LTATDKHDALRKLRQMNLVPVSVDEQRIAPVQPRTSRARASAQEITLSMQELATLLNAGVSLAEAVDSIRSAHEGTPIGTAFNSILNALRSGETFSTALQGSTLPLPSYLVQLAVAGEATGNLGQSLESAVAQMTYEDRLRSEMRNALTYPVILVVSGIAATLLVFLVVVPKFANLIKAGNPNIPWLSKWVISIGLFTKANLLWIGLGVAAAILALIVALGNPTFRERSFEMLSRMPVFGSWLQQTEMGRWASMLSALLENRVSIVMAMELAHSGVRLASLRNRLQHVLREVRAGTKLADALAATRVLGAMGINLIRVGERSGELPKMLRALATLYENAGRDRMKRFLLLLEPVSIMVIGLVIGTIMVAIMLAVTSMNEVIT
jgi:general secretion pathway protein F